MLTNSYIVGGITLIIALIGLLIPGILVVVSIRQSRRRDEQLQWPTIAAYASIMIIAAVVCITLPLGSKIFREFGRKIQSTATYDLGRLSIAQRDFLRVHGRYAYNFNELDWRPQSDLYSFYLGADVIIGKKQEVSALKLPDQYHSQATDTIYRAFAISNIDRDDTPDLWLLSDGAIPENVIDDVTR